MCPPAIAAAAAAVGTFAATATASAVVGTIVTAAVSGAIYGAIAGAAVALVTGKNAIQGALKGAGLGALTGAIAGGISAAAGSAASSTGAGVGEVGSAGLEAAASAAPEAAGVATQASGAVAPITNTTQSAAHMVREPIQQGAQGGILSGVGKALGESKHTGEILGRTLAGGAQAMLESRSTEKQIKAAMERDRIAIENQKVSLGGIDFKVALPTIAGFADQPKWSAPNGGLLWKGMQNEPAAT
jgi:hypothetical protein